VGGTAGTFFGACALAWYPDYIVTYRGRDVVEFTSVRTVATSLLRPAVWFAVVGATFSAADCMAQSARNKDDSWNAAIGGMAAGFVMGSIFKRFDYMTSSALGMGLLMGVLDWTGPNTSSKPEEAFEKMYGVMPETHQESNELAALKEKYPKYKDL
jgi:predicted lipid-binding transport protein (Tim44 family)